MVIKTLEQLGAALREARKQLGLTQSQLALASGVGVRFIVELEAGKETIQIGKALRVIRSLGGEISVDGLPSKASGEAHGA